MGFLDKLSKAVSDIKEQIDESGIIDKVKEVAAKTADTATSASSETTDQATQTEAGDGVPDGWAGAVQRTGFDPMTLLTHAEVGRIIGLTVHESYRYFDDEWFGVVWKHDAPDRHRHAEARFIHGSPDGSPPDVPGVWEYLTIEAGISDQVDLGGGVDAMRDGDSLYVNTGSTLLHLYGGGLLDDPDRAATIQQLAKATIEKL